MDNELNSQDKMIKIIDDAIEYHNEQFKNTPEWTEWVEFRDKTLIPEKQELLNSGLLEKYDEDIDEAYDDLYTNN